MLSFVKGLSGMFGQKANPIGVDFGSDSLKMAQVAWENGEPQLIAAASAEVPGHVRHNAAARLNFFAEAARELLSSGKFKGRQAILALPAASMFIQHLRVAKMDDELLKKALPWEARGKLPIDPSHALMRHIVAGEIYQDQEPKAEVILMAAARELVNQLLTAATKAKLDIIGMTVEPTALIDCFGHIYRRQEDKTAVSCFVDIGCASSRAVIAQGSQILFARSMKIGGEHLTRAVASNLKMNMDDARMLRLKLCYQQPAAVEDAHRKQEVDEETQASGGGAEVAMVNRGARLRGAAADGEESAGVGGIATAVSGQAERRAAPLAPRLPSDPRLQQAMVDEAYREPLNQLAAELDLCRRYYESTFPTKPVDRLVFVGGEARHRTLCQHVARELSLAAQVGDPLVRMGRTTNVGLDSGLDRRQAQPGWAVAIGLSLGACDSGSQAAAPARVEAK